MNKILGYVTTVIKITMVVAALVGVVYIFDTLKNGLYTDFGSSHPYQIALFILRVVLYIEAILFVIMFILKKIKK